MVVGDLAEAEGAVEVLCGFEDGVEAHAPVAEAAGFSDDGLGEGAADALALKGGTHEEALHFAEAVADLAQGDAADDKVTSSGHQEPACG